MATTKKTAKKSSGGSRKTVAKKKSAAKKATTIKMVVWSVFEPTLSAIKNELRSKNSPPSGASKDEVAAVVSKLEVLIEDPPGTQDVGTGHVNP